MKNSKKGASSIFLMFIFAAMLAVAGLFIYAARESAVQSYGDGLFNLAGNSILSEFDLNLKENYGLFGFYGQSVETESKLKYYLSYSVENNKHAELNAVKADMRDYSMARCEVLEKEILDYIKYAIAKDLLTDADEKRKGEKGKDRTLRNKMIINSLPSTALGDKGPGLIQRARDIGSQLSTLEDALKSQGETFLINRYIMTEFKNAYNQTKDLPTFFTNEVEYILEGDYSNEKNKRGVKNGLVALRTALNTTHILADSQKRTAVMTVAQVLTPGPEALLTQIIIIGTWALAEAENDAALLDHGRKVPLMKDESSWATDLDSIMSNTEKEYIEPSVDKGLSYEAYLMIFLHVQDKAIKLTRVMDLIQLNMKGNFNGEFLIREYNHGFQLDGTLNKREYGYSYEY